MTLFSQTVFTTLIHVSLALAAIGSAVLITLLARDWKGRNLW